jgi:choline dehydrogenase-like flavoprotein
VFPYFKKSEHNLDPDIRKGTEYYGADGYLSVGKFPYQDEKLCHLTAAFKGIGYREVDCNGKHQSGFMVAQMTQENSLRQSTNRAFPDPVLKRRPNRKVITNTRATKILINELNTAHGVQYILEKRGR